MTRHTIADLYRKKADHYALQARLSHELAGKQKPGTYAAGIAQRVAEKYDALEQRARHHAQELEREHEVK